jgi:uncharacterized membrane protein
MDKIIIKEYEWGKFTRIRMLVSGVICLVVSVLFIITKHTTFVKIFASLIAVAAIIFFVQCFYMLKNKIYIQVTNDGIKISPNIEDFVFSSKFVEWKDISRIKKNQSQITLILIKRGDIIIQLVFLNKDDRDNLAQIIQKNIYKNKPIT